jgi:hypothetical protein
MIQTTHYEKPGAEINSHFVKIQSRPAQFKLAGTSSRCVATVALHFKTPA